MMLVIGVMHQSFVSPAPSGPRNSGAFNINFQSPAKSPALRGHICGKSPAKSPRPQRLTIFKRRTTNYRNPLNKFSSPIPLWFNIKFGFSWPSCFREDFEHTHKHIHTRIREPSALNKLYMPLYSCSPEPAESCSR